ncbi:MAG: CDP-alcohol phosphatidyltransferase family protein [Thioploca sp.]|nr:CDP-alcohol phosphatidyltransferase family protein [Thioploca sp.]
MISIYQLKPYFQLVLRPLTRSLAAKGITANQVTVSAILLSLLSGITIVWWSSQGWPLLLLPVVLLVRMALNAIDGLLAREYHMQSPLGAILNELGDVISDAALYLPFAWLPAVYAPLPVLIVLLAVIGEMMGVVGIQIGASRRYDGPLGKSDRALAFGLLGLLLGSGVLPGSWCNVVLSILVPLAAWTIVNRVRSALLEIKS